MSKERVMEKNWKTYLIKNGIDVTKKVSEEIETLISTNQVNTYLKSELILAKYSESTFINLLLEQLNDTLTVDEIVEKLVIEHVKLDQEYLIVLLNEKSMFNGLLNKEDYLMTQFFERILIDLLDAYIEISKGTLKRSS